MADIEVVWETDGRIARVRLNRVAKLNALRRAMLDELAAAVTVIANTPTRRVVIVESTSKRAFSVGADLHEWSAYDGTAAYEASRHGQAVLAAIAGLDVPTIAAIDGLALGGGFELVLACDLRIGSTRAELGFPEAKLAGGVGWGGLSRLVPLIGPARAKDLIFTGRALAAAEAREMGLLNAVHPPEKLADAVTEVAMQIVANGPLSLQVGKQIINALSQVAALGVMEAFGGAFLVETVDAREGKAAFAERRAPVFRGR